jgi:hypothetical protein
MFKLKGRNSGARRRKRSDVESNSVESSKANAMVEAALATASQQSSSMTAVVNLIYYYFIFYLVITC